MSLKPYPQYINTPLVWCDKIPDSWKLLRAKNVFDAIDIRSKSGLEELLSVSEKSGVTPRRLATVTMFKAESYVGYKLCWSGDLVINSLWAWMQGLGFSTHHGIVSSAYGVYRLKPNYAGEFKYFNYLLRSSPYLWELRVKSKGIWKSRYQLTDESFFTIPIIIPPVQDRRQVVKYLDWKTSQINRFIKEKKRQIELLNEQKQVIINDAVTGRIDVRTGKPYPKYKESGLEWLGIIPEIWSLFPLKRIALSNQKALGEKVDPEYEFDYLEINKVKAGYLVDTPTRLIFKNSPSRARRIVSYGDTIISTVRTYLRSVYFIDKQNIKDLIVSTGFCVLTPKTGISAEYLGYLLRSDYFISRVIQNSVGVSYPAISDVKLMSLKVPLPTFNEQQQIVKFILSYNKNLDRMVSTIETEVKLLQEYKACLIADVVTGKLDARDISVPEFDIENEIEGVVDGAELSEDIEEEVVANE